MLRILHWLVVGAYFAAPVVATGHAVVRGCRGRITPLARLLLTTLSGALLGTGLTLAYALIVRGRASFAQFAPAAYFATSLLLLVKGLDAVLRLAVKRFAKQRVAAALGGLIRVVVLIGIGLPYVMAAVMTYRPKVVPRDDPMQQLGFRFVPVEFKSTDGMRLDGWWIPAQGRRSSQTVLVCHGLGASKSNQLVLARKLVPGGYNALAFDFRAHGQSAGQLTSFGDLERRDVLGAVRWLRENHPDESRRIVGVGASMGAAALLAAAADEGADGQSIEAIAVYGTYDDLGSLAKSIGREHFVPPMGWLAARIGLLLASVQVGTNLGGFRPADYARRLWPRPILVIHGQSDEIIPFAHGQRLFDAASFPRRKLWIGRGTHNDIINDEQAAQAVLDFLDHATPTPVI